MPQHVPLSLPFPLNVKCLFHFSQLLRYNHSLIEIWSVRLTWNMGYPIKYPLQWFWIKKPSHWFFWFFFPLVPMQEKVQNVPSLKILWKVRKKIFLTYYHGKERSVIIVMFSNFFQLLFMSLEKVFGKICRVEWREGLFLSISVVAFFPPVLQLVPAFEDELFQMLQLQHVQLFQLELKLKKESSHVVENTFGSFVVHIFEPTEVYSRDLNSELVCYSNGPK